MSTERSKGKLENGPAPKESRLMMTMATAAELRNVMGIKYLCVAFAKYAHTVHVRQCSCSPRVFGWAQACGGQMQTVCALGSESSAQPFAHPQTNFSSSFDVALFSLRPSL